MDVAIAGIAARQRGVIGLRQLKRLGLTASGVRDRVRTGRLHRVHRGVYAVGHPVLSLEGRWWAAVLACGDDAALSHRSAGHALDVRRTDRFAVDVTVATGSRSRRGIDVHRSALTPADITFIDGLPVTTVARTLLDLGDVLDLRGIERALEQADRLRILDLADVRRVLAGANGRRGAGLLATAIRLYDPDMTRTRSELERMFLRLCRRAGLPAPVVNDEVDGVEADFFWPELDLIVELDGNETHGTRAAFERDRRRDQRHAVAGRRTIRVTYRQLEREPGNVETTLRALACGTRRR